MPLSLDRNTQHLLASLEKVLSEWAFLGVEFLGEPAQNPPSLPLERSVTLSSAKGEEARLVVRGSFGLGLELARVVRGLPAASLPAAEAAFVELSSLLAEEWRLDLKQEASLDLRVSAPFGSTPEDWPQTQAVVAFAAVVRGFAIEVRAWMPSI